MLRGLLAALTLFASVTFSHAAQVGSYSVGNWFVGIYTDDTTGKFSNCMGSTRYNSGIDLIVYVSRDYLWDLGFSSPSWNLQPGTRMSVRYRFDRAAWTDAMLEVVTPSLVRMPMPSSGTVVGLFRKSRMMEVYDGSRSYYFSLDATSRLLVSLAQCIGDSVAREGATVANAPVVVSSASLQLEGTRVLSNFLMAAQITDAELLSEPEFPKELAFAHAVAAATGGLGFALVIPTDERTPDATAAQISSSMSETCDGKFGSGSTKDTVEGASLINAFSACQKESDGYSLQYVVVSRKPVGQYVIGILTASGAKTPEKSAASSAPVSTEKLMQAAYKASQ
jgi:hypothetical protein